MALALEWWVEDRRQAQGGRGKGIRHARLRRSKQRVRTALDRLARPLDGRRALRRFEAQQRACGGEHLVELT